jgi:O-antigen/teichoic acid export membrane protein
MKPTALRIVDWASRIFKTDLRYSLSGGFFLTLIQITSAIVSFALTVAFANLLPVEAYGTYRYVLAAYAIFAIAALPGVDTAVIQSVALGRDGTYIRALFLKARWSLLGAALAISYAAYLFTTGQIIMASLFVIAGLSLPAMESFALYSAYFNGKRQFKEWAKFDIWSQALSAVSLIAAMMLTKHIVVIMFAYFVPYIVARAISNWNVLKHHIADTRIDENFASYGRSVTVFQIISRLSSSMDQVILYHFLGPAQVAIYTLAMAIPNRMQSLFKISGILAFPRFAERDGKDIAASLPRKMAAFGMIILIACVAYVAISPLLFTHLFPKYMASLPFSQIAVFFTLSAITYPFSSFLFAHKKLAANYVVSVGSFAAKVLCLIAFVPLYGIWGAIAGILAASLATILLSIWLLVRERGK